MGDLHRNADGQTDLNGTLQQNGLFRITVGGQQFDVDDEAIKDLNAKGMEFSGGPMDNGVGDFSRGAAHGATLGFADKKFGDSNQSVMERLGGDSYDEVKERSPIKSAAGDFAGSMAIPVPGGPASTGMAAMYLPKLMAAGRVATQGAVGAGMGAARAYAEGEDPSSGAALGGGLGALGAAGSEAISAGVNAVSPYIAKALNATADVARTKGVFGMGGGSDRQLMGVAAKFGLDELPAKLAKTIEDMAPAEGLMGRSRDDYRKVLEPIIEESGKDLGAIRQHIGQDQGVSKLLPAEYASMRQNLQNKLDNIIVYTDKDDAEKAALTRILERFDQNPDPKNLTQLADIKSHYQEAGHTGPLGSIPDNASAEMNAATGKEGKQTLERLLDYSTDDIHAAHDAASERYGTASMLHDQIAPKSLREAFNTNAAGLGATAASTLAGGLTGAISSDNPIQGAATGASIGFGASMNTGTRNFMSQLLAQPKAMDTIANLSRALGTKLADVDLNKLKDLVQAYTGKLSGYAADE